MNTKLVSIRKPNSEEKKTGAEVVFIRRGGNFRYKILACRCHESFEQWGAETSILGDNVKAVEIWLKNMTNEICAS